jgi:glutamate/aspartate transport system permease protein
MFNGYSWNWGVFFEPVSTGEGTTYLGWLLSGLSITVFLAICASLLALCVGVVMGILRTTPNRCLSALGTAYVGLFRNVPLIVQLFIWYFVMPELVPSGIGTWFKNLPSLTQMLTSAVLCLGLYMGARVCEQIRAGIGTLPPGQTSAALALGLTLPQAYRYVLLPVAIRVVIPPLTSELMNLVKNSAVVSTIGLLDLSAQSEQLVEYTSQAYESFTVATLAYVSINWVVMLAMRHLEKSVRIPGYIGSK